jgi:hypothetical protein
VSCAGRQRPESNPRASITGVLANAIYEVCNGQAAIEDWEFGTRIGASGQEAETLLGALHDVP